MTPWIRHKLTFWLLFDVSVAFDTVDQDIPIRRLLVSFGISAKLLEEIYSFCMGVHPALSLGPLDPIGCHSFWPADCRGLCSCSTAVHPIQC